MQHFAWEKTVSIATSTRMSGVQYEDNHDMQNERAPATGNTRLSAGIRGALWWESLLKVCTTQKNKRYWLERSQKANSTLTLDLWHKGAALCAYRGGSNTLYDSIMCVVTHHLSTLLWTLGAPIQLQTDQASLIHSPPRCLCQVIAGGKRKTDQYISHGTDR